MDDELVAEGFGLNARPLGAEGTDADGDAAEAV